MDLTLILGGWTGWLGLCSATPFFLAYDVSGWDRGLPLLQTVYSLRNKFLPEEWESLSAWVAKHTIHSHMQHFDGFIFEKHVGNNSGSGNTTADNIIAHMFILGLALFKII